MALLAGDERCGVRVRMSAWDSGSLTCPTGIAMGVRTLRSRLGVSLRATVLRVSGLPGGTRGPHAVLPAPWHHAG